MRRSRRAFAVQKGETVCWLNLRMTQIGNDCDDVGRKRP
jgi:hypothetical protein